MALSFRLYTSQSKHQLQYVTAMRSGLRRHGIAAEIFARNEYEPSDVAIQWARNSVAQKKQAENGGRLLIMERGYIDRMRYASVGWNDINGRADHCAEGMPSDRYSRLWRGSMRDWDRRETRVALIIGQVPGDASLGNVRVEAWAREAADFYLAAGYRVVWRPHPIAQLGLGIFGELADRIEQSTTPSLEHDMRGAEVVVTCSSTTGVESVLFGKRTVATSDFSVARPIAGEVFGEHKICDRWQWASDLAYRQWSEKEIALGDAWEHVSRGLSL